MGITGNRKLKMGTTSRTRGWHIMAGKDSSLKFGGKKI